MDMGEQIFTDAINHLQEELMETLKQSFEDMIQQVIQGLIEQIIESKRKFEPKPLTDNPG
jgi:hypothetical protein